MSSTLYITLYIKLPRTKEISVYKNRAVTVKSTFEQPVVQDFKGPFIVIGAGEYYTKDTLEKARKVAFKIRSKGWWVTIVDEPTRALVAEFGNVTDTPNSRA